MKAAFELEDKFQPYLKNGDYTFTGPIGKELLDEFINTLNITTSPVRSLNTLHTLSNKKRVRQVLQNMLVGQKPRVYVIKKNNSQMLLPITIEEYCKEHNIQFP